MRLHPSIAFGLLFIINPEFVVASVVISACQQLCRQYAEGGQVYCDIDIAWEAPGIRIKDTCRVNGDNNAISNFCSIGAATIEEVLSASSAPSNTESDYDRCFTSNISMPEGQMSVISNRLSPLLYLAQNSSNIIFPVVAAIFLMVVICLFAFSRRDRDDRCCSSRTNFFLRENNENQFVVGMPTAIPLSVVPVNENQSVIETPSNTANRIVNVC